MNKLKELCQDPIKLTKSVIKERYPITKEFTPNKTWDQIIWILKTFCKNNFYKMWRINFLKDTKREISIWFDLK